ncbi:MAG: hypothetical protein JWO55_53 [Candidatus Saccharibacteria bacterium]|jgi:hypothetical protein|nr:hypothetical protein [Candidatus Saccharibacteria bacterium]
MEYTSTNIESVTISDILDLASWNRQRSTEELQSFIQTRHNRLPDDTELE